MNKKSKAFTLYETVITLSIFAIIMALITVMVMTISNITRKQQRNFDCLAEYQEASNVIESFVNAYSLNGFSLNVDESSLTANDGEQEFILAYEGSTNKLTSQIFDYQTTQVKIREITFKKIVKISFIAQNSYVKCNYIFENFPTYTNLFKFGVD